MRTDGNRYSDDYPPVAREGWLYIVLALAAAAVAGFAGWGAVAALLGVAAVFILWFFRDPRRTSPAGRDLALSPADGRVLSVEQGTEDRDVGHCTVICIFMNVFNVHVNRCPVDGAVTAVRRHPGTFLPADRKEAPLANERVEAVFAGPRGAVKCVQVAGLIARRIICRLRPAEETVAGQRYGLIKFGSRVDVYLPTAYRPAVAEGDRVLAGVTVLARAGEGQP